MPSTLLQIFTKKTRFFFNPLDKSLILTDYIHNNGIFALFLFLPPSHYTKKTYPTFPNHTTPRWEKRARVHVNFYNKPDGSGKKNLYFDIIHPSAFICVHLRFQKRAHFVTNLYQKNAPFFSTLLTKP